MACPYFYPVRPEESGRFEARPRLPLGETWTGECRASMPSRNPGERRLSVACNWGYASERCDWLPADRVADAVRVHLAGDDGATIHLLVTMERAGWPTGAATVEYSRPDARFIQAHADPTVQRQVEAWLDVQLRRRA